MPQPPLRVFLALGLGVAGLVATLVLALVASRVASQRLEARIEAELADLAEHMAGQLDRGLFERWRDMVILAENDTIRDPAAPVERKRRVMRRAQETYSDYAIIGLIDAAGRIEATSTGALEGIDVAHRDYFTRGRHGPFVGDVHDALLLAALKPGHDPADPPRVLDIAAPVRADDGRLVGVVSGHLDWAWARGVEASLRETSAGQRDVTALVLARDGTVLLGPDALRRTTLPAALPSVAAARAGRAGTETETWPDGRRYLTGYRPTRGYRDYPGLGWTVLVRQDAGTAFASVADLRRQILLWGLVVATLAAGFGWFAAGLLARPLRRLAVAAAALGRGAPVEAPASAVREAQAISHALTAAAAALQRQEAERRAADARQELLIHELNHRVKNTLATVQSMARQTARSAASLADFTGSFEARLLAMSQTHNVLTANHWEGAGLRGILSAELEPYSSGRADRIRLDGPPVSLTPAMALPLGMAIHELATNAAKYGALSAEAGQVAVEWRVGPGALELRWRESGGPRVVPPTRTGFGTRLIRASLERELAGEVRFDFAEGGLACLIAVPLAVRTEAA
ncbi:sensor histidine kinase [Methylobacterium nonmethylotrophicum]|uniref:histidine kinase n=1 Tax=Methylobacterium nonmethylotrophicum TaxID=1141884 RepID=A0A4Z0NWJ1_9HYPH|nr:sensor histidine kinase [Methylobacterium nonmethylotrophicum]TGE02240.1 histidine kinase [Methylobacterium nonmethylotrophicum]